MNKNNEQGTKKGFLSGVDQNTCPLIDTLRPFSNIELVIFRGSTIFLKDEAYYIRNRVKEIFRFSHPSIKESLDFYLGKKLQAIKFAQA